MDVSLRRDEPVLWAEFVATIRETVGDWSEDQIAAVANKVRSASPDELPTAIYMVFEWCAAATRSGDEEAIATVEIWQMSEAPVIIFADETGGVRHALDVDSYSPTETQP